MANIKCPSCGRDIRYVVAAPSLHAGNNGLIAVETHEEEMLTEKGRLVRGFKRHKCRISPISGSDNVLNPCPFCEDKTNDQKVRGGIIGSRPFFYVRCHCCPV
jgi:hypothetical protein